MSGDDKGSLVYSFDHVLLLFGEEGEGLARAREAARRSGCRVAGEAPLAGGVARLDRQIAVDAALVVADAPSDELDALLTRLCEGACAGRMRGVVASPSAMIDYIFSADLPAEVEHLVAPGAAELELAIAQASERTRAQFHDVSRRDGAPLLQRLSEDAARIATMLAALSEENGGTPAREEAEASPVDAGFVRSIIRARRMRDQFFHAELFADPAFDMLLDLYSARLEGARVAVSSLCIAAAVPATTALRWIRALTDQGLFVRAADPQDGRRVYIELSEEATRAMGRYLSAVQRSGVPAI